jgi:beta-glucosidase-like glycosyl hydrolase
MSAHVAYPAIGAKGAATLEETILVDLLRREMGFEGLVLTDALNMSGVRDGAASDSPEVRALEAGCDLLLYPPDLAAGIAACEAAAATSERVAARLGESLDRGARMLERFPGRDRGEAGEASGAGAAAAAASAAEMAAACVLPVSGAVPAWLSPGAPVRVSTVWDDREEPSRLPFGEPFRAALASVGWQLLPPGAADPDVPTILLVASTPQAWKGTASLTPVGRAAVDGILEGDKVYPILFGHPRLFGELGASGLCAWATEPAMEVAAARRLDELAREGPR